jgi:hypothetical protein
MLQHVALLLLLMVLLASASLLLVPLRRMLVLPRLYHCSNTCDGALLQRCCWLIQAFRLMLQHVALWLLLMVVLASALLL